MSNPFPDLPHPVRNYLLNSVLGHGIFGTVFKATNINYQLDFAVKVICQLKLSDHNSATFEAEVNSLIKLDHPNVIRIYDFFKEDDYMFIVLEYCSGGTLEDRIKKNEIIPKSEKKYICYQIISALKYCCENSVAHRDIKTSNILFDSNGRVKVADFGLSQIIHNNDDNFITKFGGSLSYVSPEICKKVAFNPFKSDVWSLGVLFYRLFTYSYPFEGRTKLELKNRIIEGFYPEKLKGSVAKIVRLMLNVAPELRPSIIDIDKMNVFHPKASNIPIQHYGSTPWVPMSMVPQRISTKRKNQSQSSLQQMSPRPIAKCISVHNSHSFLTSPQTV